MCAGAVGASLFFGSFGLLLLPVIGGWSWLSAGIAFVGVQYASQVLLDLPEYWDRASAYLLILKLGVKGKIGDGLNGLAGSANQALAG